MYYTPFFIFRSSSLKTDLIIHRARIKPRNSFFEYQRGIEKYSANPGLWREAILPGMKEDGQILIKISLIISLSIVILAFRWAVHPTPPELEALYVTEDESIPMIRTVHKRQKSLPPPVVRPSEEPIPEELDLEFTEDWIPEDPEAEYLEELPAEPEEHIAPPPVPPEPELPKPKEEIISDFVFIAEEMPVFGDCLESNLSRVERRRCSDQAILSYFAKNLRYPPVARDNQITGMVVIQFVIDLSGQVSDAKIVREIGGGCGQEAIRVAMSMPRWRPGKQRGRPVRVQMNLPVRFELR